ncbi:MAG: glycosyltransferase family 39 protein [Gemmatimonadales bacterium]
MSVPDRGVLTGLILIGLALRLAAIDWGMGIRQFDGYYVGNESKVWRSTAGFPGNYLTNKQYIYGTALQNAVGAALLPAKALWRAGYRRPFLGLEYHQLVILAHRAVNAVLGALTLLFVYLLGRLLYDNRTGILAAGLLCFSLVHVTHSGFGTLDIAMGFLGVVTILLAARAFETGRRRDFLYLGLVGGFLAATKISGLLILAVPCVLFVNQAFTFRDGLRGASAKAEASAARLPRDRSPTFELARNLSLSLLVALAVFVVSTPQVLLHLGAYMDAMAEQRLLWVARVEHSLPTIAGEWVSVTARAMTPVVATLAGIGLLLGRVGVKRGQHALEYALLAYIAATILFWRAYLQPRFMIPIVPILCLYAARPAILLMGQRRRSLRAAGIVVATVALSAGAFASTAEVLYRRNPDTRTAAAAYIARHVPAGASLAVASTTAENPWTTHRWRYPVVDTSKYVLTSVLEHPDYIITSSYALDQMEDALASGHLDSDLNWPQEMASSWYRYIVPKPEDFAFFSSLLREEEYVIAARWQSPPPVPVDTPEPEIRLYRRRSVGRTGAE